MLIISIMEVEFDTRFKYPWSMIFSGPSSSVKTVFTKQVLNKSDEQFENIYIDSIPNGKTDTDIARESDLCLAYHPRWTRTYNSVILVGRVPIIQWAKGDCL